ncbi:hypothetical protein P154DRAFT_542819 [Amniculicola lignicola CBS 123094]|uniref:Sister chromatid cohesion protein Ctf8 n=1 Tax=Amniculicola lignicola CBS 123094 TaxID=1392246 RepID=A0A6A5WTK3_9PLEO|nr:hypothetical protein P154DRAFT_542819 [Amniculicola lignicola CBS 123094]
MPSIPLHVNKLSPASISATASSNPLPPLLHTPSGLGLLELQGTIHFPTVPTSTSSTAPANTSLQLDASTLVGKLVFPLYNPELRGEDDTSWMKRVYMYVGENQRLTGECKKLGKPFGLMQRKERGREDVQMGGIEEEGSGEEELEIVEVVRYKIVFSSRPEPVGGEVQS